MFGNFGRSREPVLLYILHTGNLYGTERMALATLVGLNEYLKRVVFAPKPVGVASIAVEARQLGFETGTFETRGQLLKILLPWFLRYRCIDIIGTGTGQSLICHALSRLLHVRLRQLQVIHGGTAEWHAYGRKHYLNHIPIRVIAVSEYVKRKLVEHGLRPEVISVIENFLSEAQRRQATPRAPYDPALDAARPIDRSKVQVAVVSRIDAIKRIDLLVDAVATHGLAEFDFHIYGTGEELATLSERAAAMPNVHFHGFVERVEDRLSQADFLLHLCPEEPFGLVVLEAFLTRLVVIVPDAGGAGGLVEDGMTGLRYQANDIDDLCRVLQAARALEGAQLQHMTARAKLELSGRFSEEEGLRRYREALSADRPQAARAWRARAGGA